MVVQESTTLPDASLICSVAPASSVFPPRAFLLISTVVFKALILKYPFTGSARLVVELMIVVCPAELSSVLVAMIGTGSFAPAQMVLVVVTEKSTLLGLEMVRVFPDTLIDTLLSDGVKVMYCKRPRESVKVSVVPVIVYSNGYEASREQKLGTFLEFCKRVK